MRSVPALIALAVLLAGCGDSPVAPPAIAPATEPQPARSAGHSLGPSTLQKKHLVTITYEPATLRMGDLIGSATIQLAGEVGGAVHGTMSISIGGNRTVYVVRSGELIREGEGYRWVLEGLAIVAGQGPNSRPFRSELVLRSGATLADGDTWTIGGSTYIRDQGDWICL